MLWLIIGEAFAVTYGLRLANDIGSQNVILELDSLQVVQSINSATQDNPSLSLICMNISSLLASFNANRCVHIRREGNKVAHALAKTKSNESILMEDLPDRVVPLVNSDVSHFSL